MQKRLIVIGGGAAGFFCAVNAALMNKDLKVTVVEKTSKLLSKVRVSGGGRCNVTHACYEIPSLVKRYPRGTNFLKKAFHDFATTDCIKWFEDRGVRLKTEDDGRMFSITDSSQTIIDCLLREANKYNVEILMNREVKKISKGTDKNLLLFADGSSIAADFVCIACGGFPKTAMFDWLKELGHTIEEPVPSLFTFNIPKHPITELMGVSVNPVTVKVIGTKLTEQGPVLITHWGLSGPAVIKLSAWGARELAQKNYHFTIQVNWLNDLNEHFLRDRWNTVRNEHATQKTGNRNPFNLPSRLWLYLLKESGIDAEMRWSVLPGKEQNKLIKNLVAQEFEVNGKTTFKEEFVTCGGIKLNEISPQTMESKLVKNVFFAGEIMDVDGITGGFNFQHAWTSGWLAAKTISDRS